MFAKRQRKHLDIWPGYVDALATLLMIIVFVLLAFVMAQMYLSDALSTRETSISALNSKIALLTEKLSTTQDELTKNQGHFLQISKNFEQSQDEKQQLTKENKEIQEIVKSLETSLQNTIKVLDEEQSKNLEKDQELKSLQAKLNLALLDKVDELKKINEELLKVKDINQTLDKENAKYKKQEKVSLYRSEFFAKLKDILGSRQDVLVVGDRFVFQSEVLFDTGSADLEAAGKSKLQELSKALKDITKKIPEDVQWILRIDGHTDKMPIKSGTYSSNWQLSTARAISVVQFLIQEGIEPKRLVAAGFGEFQPLTDKELEKNRRIEFKLDQR